MAKIAKHLLQLIKVKYFIVALLVVELFAALYPIKVETKVKNNLASWPWSQSARKAAELIINRPNVILNEIAQWEKYLTEENESRDVLLKLSLLYYQLYQDEQAKIYWQRAVYLDPLFVASLPVQLF